MTLKLSAILGLQVLSAVAIRLIFPSLPVVMPHSASAPFGLYLKTHDSHDPYAIFCMSPDARRIAETHHIITHGSCPDGTEPLLKPLVPATVDDPVVFTAQGFYVHGRLLPNTAPKPFALDGKTLEHYPFGVYREGLWAISGFTKDSFDSRYYGPISAVSLVAYARPLVTLR